MVNMTIVNNEQCGGNRHYVVMEVTHTALSKQTKHKGDCRVTCVLAKLRAHYTTAAIPK